MESAKYPGVDEVYVKLRDRYNEMGFGYAPTESGVEFTLLKRFVTPQDAEAFLDMDPDAFFTAGQFAEKSGRNVEACALLLDDLSHRGIIYREDREDGHRWYRAMPVAHGLYEFNVDKLEPEWVGGLFTHFGEGMLAQVYDAGIPFYRSVPINAEVVEGGQVMAYDDIAENVDRYDTFALSPCACRAAAKTVGALSCDHDLGTCITTGRMAEYYIENGIGEQIDKKRVLDILHASVDKGMVIQTCYSKAGEIICSCSLCCCGILQANKMFPGSGSANISHYRIRFDRDSCNGCGACMDICPMQAIAQDEDGKPVTDASCVGCGNCVAKCPEQGRILVRKDEDEMAPLPDTVFDAYIEMEDIRRKAGKIA